MRQPKIGDSIESLIDGAIKQGDIGTIEGFSSNGAKIRVKPKYGDIVYFTIARQNETWKFTDYVNPETFKKPVNNPTLTANGFVGSYNLPYDSDIDDIEDYKFR